jgi:hypothetical protein
MYPIEIYLMIAVIDGGLSLFSLLEKGMGDYQDLFGISNIVNIVALIIADFLSVYLALVSVSGTATLNGIPMQDGGLMWIWMIIAVVQGVFILLELMEAYVEHLNGQEESGSLIS